MIDTHPFVAQQVRAAYNRRSWIYDKTVAPLEFDYHRLALARAAIQPREKVLEVAVGPGRALLEIVKRVDRDNVVHGVDLPAGMLQIARQTIAAAGFTNVDLSEADARRLRFPDDTFDVLYNGYMLDLIPLDGMGAILAEFRRVLKPGGRLVLLNMSKRDERALTMRERLYQSLPPSFVLYFMGGCRPVLMEQPVKQAGFREVERQFVDGKFPSEIVTGLK